MMRFKNQNGNTLIGSLLALVCLAVMVTASFSFMMNSRKSTNRMLQVNVRDKMVSTMKMVVRLPTSIQVSHDGANNQPLRNCLDRLQVFDDSIPGDCQGGVLQSFSLYGPMRNTSGGVDALSGELAGTEDKPVRYNNMGAAADPNEAASIYVRSWFKPQCPPKNFGEPPAPVCDVAEAVEFTYEIESHFPDVVGGPPKIRKMNESVVYAVADIGNNKPSVPPEKVDPPPPLPIPPVVAAPPSPPAPASSGAPIAGGGGGGITVASTPVVVPAAPIMCFGDTIQIGPNQCSCPPGQKLISPRRGKCGKVSI